MNSTFAHRLVVFFILLLGGNLHSFSQANPVKNLDKHMSSEIPVPKAPMIVKKDTIHSKILVDNYYWLRERNKKEVISYLEEENEYTRSMSRHTSQLREDLYAEILGRIKEDDSSVPEKDGEFYYYNRTEQGKSYDFYCRKKNSLDNDEEIILDENQLAEGHEYCRVGDVEVSEDHQLMAYSVDFNGSEKFDVFIKDLSDGKVVDDHLKQTAGSVFFSKDKQYLFYTRLDETMRPYQLYRHRIGQDTKNDLLVYQENDPRFYVYAGTSKSSEYIFLYMGSSVTTEVRVLKADDPTGEFKTLCPRVQNIEYSVTHQGQSFYILTNEKAVNFKLMRSSVNELQKSKWEEVIPHDPNVMLNSVEGFSKHLVIYGRENGMKNILILKNEKLKKVHFPDQIFTYWSGENPEYQSEHIRLTYSTLVKPRVVYDYQIESEEFTFLK